MKKYRGPLILVLFLLLLAGVCWIMLQATAEYPTLGQPVAYPVNQLDGFTLSMKKPAWSPFKGYIIRYEIAAHSDETCFMESGAGYRGVERLERLVDGQWYRLQAQAEHTLHSDALTLGGDGNSGCSGSFIQTYEGCGTRLEPGTYRFIVDLMDAQGDPHHLATEFSI